MNAGDDPQMKENGIAALREAMSLAEAEGTDGEQKVAFIKMILEREGKLEHDHSVEGGCCKDGKDDGCDDHSEVAKAVATGEDGWAKEVSCNYKCRVMNDGWPLPRRSRHWCRW